jgi:hypothetical protein
LVKKVKIMGHHGDDSSHGVRTSYFKMDAMMAYADQEAKKAYQKVYSQTMAKLQREAVKAQKAHQKAQKDALKPKPSHPQPQARPQSHLHQQPPYLQYHSQFVSPY